MNEDVIRGRAMVRVLLGNDPMNPKPVEESPIMPDGSVQVGDGLGLTPSEEKTYAQHSFTGALDAVRYVSNEETCTSISPSQNKSGMDMSSGSGQPSNG